MSVPGRFCGIGVGPGEPGLIPVVAWEFLKLCDVIYVPRARTMDHSVARQCLPANEIPAQRFREVEFTMDPDRDKLRQHYADLAAAISTELRAGKDTAWLTIGDPMTYSTYIYTLAALKDSMPELRPRTYPGVTSYCALAAAAEFPPQRRVPAAQGHGLRAVWSLLSILPGLRQRGCGCSDGASILFQCATACAGLSPAPC